MPCAAVCVDSVEAQTATLTSVEQTPDLDVSACHNDHCVQKRVTLSSDGFTVCNGVWSDGCGLVRDDAKKLWLVSIRWREPVAPGDMVRLKVVEHASGKVVRDDARKVPTVEREAMCGSSCRTAKVDFDGAGG